MMRLTTHMLIACIAAASAASLADAEPDLRQPMLAAGLKVFPDARQAHVFYYAPGHIDLMTAADGAPDLHLLQLRYTGNIARGDQGSFLTRSFLQLRVEMEGPGRSAIDAAQHELRRLHRRAALRPLPVNRIVSGLVFVSLERAAEGSEITLPEGRFEPPDSDSSEGAGVFWTERYYTVALNDHTSQMLADAFAHGRVAMSFGYAFFTDGIGPEHPLEELTGDPVVVDLVRQRLDSLEGSGDAELRRAHLVRADAFAITVDPAQHSEVVQQYDVDGGLPPGFPLLDVYCFDFTDELRPDLYEKHVEIEAEGVSGQAVRATLIFGVDREQVSSHRVRFQHAVRMDRPYRMRMREVALDGGAAASPWRDGPSWTDRIDVTSTVTEESEQ